VTPVERAPSEPVTRLHHADNDVLTAEEMRAALKLSERQWSRVAPTLPVSYALGRQTPRYVYGEVVNFLRKTGAAA
jgi:hypothetical protein